ncbi:MAG: 16S rRNA (cytosine(1402)-N(4))-methyltransferase RsmH [Gemmatimonadales bacterium]
MRGVVVQRGEDTITQFLHDPVLLEEVGRALAGCRRVLDGTAGAGGHARYLADHGAEVVALDRDPAAVEAATHTLAGKGDVRLLDFAAATTDEVIRAFHPDGILLDLGVSSPQIDDATRGFTFRRGAPLDMRMSGSGMTAEGWLNGSAEAELAGAFRDFGDERRARALARQIVQRRATRQFTISDDLVGAIRAALGPKSGPPDFARLFQAVRIAVNGELERLEQALPDLLDILEPGGVIAVIAYHSGEDRIVKNAFRDWAKDCICPPEQPICTCRGKPLGEVLTRRPIEAGEDEVARNPRARSARLRAFRKAQ